MSIIPLATYKTATRRIHYFTVATVVAILCLLCSGGLVTSHGVGLAVPDWPNTFGYNMFLFPMSKWVGGVFFEHTHRLWGSLIGFLTILLVIFLVRWEERLWLRRLGYLALAAVILQGVLGGLRVTMMKDQIGIFHACLAQTFFVLMGLIALFTSRWWIEISPGLYAQKINRRWLTLVFAICALIYIQLILGATMRHAHLGLAIPDFPLAYGQIWPHLDSQVLSQINEARVVSAEPDTTITQIRLQLFHRLIGTLIVIGIIISAVWILREKSSATVLKRGVLLWMTLVILQFILGAATIWSHKAADIATAHMAVGALTLFTGFLIAAIACRIRWVSARGRS